MKKIIITTITIIALTGCKVGEDTSKSGNTSLSGATKSIKKPLKIGYISRIAQKKYGQPMMEGGQCSITAFNHKGKTDVNGRTLYIDEFNENFSNNKMNTALFNIDGNDIFLKNISRYHPNSDYNKIRGIYQYEDYKITVSNGKEVDKSYNEIAGGSVGTLVVNIKVEGGNTVQNYRLGEDCIID